MGVFKGAVKPWLCGFVVVLLSTGSQAFAQSDDALSDYEKWKLEQQQAYTSFRTEADKAFIAYLEAEWVAFQVFKGHVRDSTPKPAVAPAIKHEASSLAYQQVPGEFVVENRTRTAAAGIAERVGRRSFFGHQVPAIRLPVNRLPPMNKPSDDLITQAWKMLSSVDHHRVRADLEQWIDQLSLGDWGVLRLVKYVVASQFPDDNHKNVYAWFLLNRLGYDLRLGYSHDQLVLLIPAKHTVFGKRYSLIGGKSYYMVPEPDSEEVLSYPVNAVAAADQQDFDFSMTRLIKPAQLMGNVDISYRLGDDITDQLRLAYDLGIVEFMETHPQVELPWYFTIKPSIAAAVTLNEQFSERVEGLPVRQAVAYMLHITQYLFGYKTDGEQFGYERNLAIEESLHYGTNDCEDRSIFLAWLIKSVLNREVVALDYPGHVALAVDLPAKVGDKTVMVGNHPYVVIDPTYEGAGVGVPMPAMEGHEPDIIAVNYD